MKCPRCNVDLKPSDVGEYGFTIIDVCPKCGGAWFDKGEVDRLDESIWTDVEKVDFDKVTYSFQNLICPKCNNELEPLSPKNAKGLIFDRCSLCEGFWLDKGELDGMRKIAAMADVKIGDEMIPLERPHGWSWLRWSIFCFKDYYLKKNKSI